MRKITQEAVYKFLYDTNKTWSKGNMIVDNELGYITLYLHGNAIASRKAGSLEIKISNAGWFSNTTKERLNGLPGVRINQKDFIWYLNGKEWDGRWVSV